MREDYALTQQWQEVQIFPSSFDELLDEFVGAGGSISVDNVTICDHGVSLVVEVDDLVSLGNKVALVKGSLCPIDSSMIINALANKQNDAILFCPVHQEVGPDHIRLARALAPSSYISCDIQGFTRSVDSFGNEVIGAAFAAEDFLEYLDIFKSNRFEFLSMFLSDCAPFHLNGEFQQEALSSACEKALGLARRLGWNGIYVVTLGSDGIALIGTSFGVIVVPPPVVNVIDSNGAGDAAHAMLLQHLLTHSPHREPGGLGSELAVGAAKAAARAGAWATTSVGLCRGLCKNTLL
jgi:sugar/nucleoside kinase (ribokinase family)